MSKRFENYDELESSVKDILIGYDQNTIIGIESTIYAIFAPYEIKDIKILTFPLDMPQITRFSDNRNVCWELDGITIIHDRPKDGTCTFQIVFPDYAFAFNRFKYLTVSFSFVTFEIMTVYTNDAL